jgi:transcriptional regulator with XRE-family HTH domain
MENGPARAPRRANEIGPVGHYAARNLESLREARLLSQKDLAAVVSKLGRPMTMQIVSKIEKGERRIDADDLIAFALALKVAPSALLLPRDVDVDDDTTTIQLTERVYAGADAAWLWMDGRAPLPTSAPEPVPGPDGRMRVYETPHDQFADFIRYSRPKGSGAELHPAMKAAENVLLRLRVLLRDTGNPSMWDLYNNYLGIWHERLGFELEALKAENESRARQAVAASGVPKTLPSSGDPRVDEELRLADVVKRSGGEHRVVQPDGTVRPVVEQPTEGGE